jgi:hypothetical protein
VVKGDSSQLELFNAGPQRQQPKPRASSAFLSYIWNYEKAILIIVGFIVVGLVAFCLGIERGKKIMAKAFGPDTVIYDTAIPVRPDPVIKTLPKLAVKEKQEVAPIKVTKPAKGNFTIQIASFKSSAYANREINNLKKMGYSALTFNRGGYTIVCIGNFASKDDASTLLAKLKKQYRDCVIRRL